MHNWRFWDMMQCCICLFIKIRWLTCPLVFDHLCRMTRFFWIGRSTSNLKYFWEFLFIYLKYLEIKSWNRKTITFEIHRWNLFSEKPLQKVIENWKILKIGLTFICISNPFVAQFLTFHFDSVRVFLEIKLFCRIP